MGAGNSIARGNVLISTNADQLHSGLRKAGNDVDKWGKGAGAKAGKGMGGGLIGGLKGAGPLLAAGLAIAGVSKIANEFSELSEEIDKVSKLAVTLDMPTEKLVGWQHAANLSGVESDALADSLLRFRKNTTGDMSAALMKLADDYTATTDAGARAKMLVDAFGKSGAKLSPMFKEGGEGIRKMIQDAKDLGIAFDESTGQQIEAANDAITRTKTSIKGLGQGFLVIMAPMIEGIANFATKFFQLLRPVMDWYGRAWGTIGEIAGLIWDVIVEGAQEVVNWVKEIVSGMDLFSGTMPTIREVIVAVFRAVGIAASLAWDTIKSGAGVISIAAGTIVLGFGKVVEVFKQVVMLAENLPEDLRPAGIDRFIQGVKDFETGVFATGDKMVAWGEGAVMGWGNSAEEFNSWLDKALNKTKEIKKAGDGIGGGEDAPGDVMKLSGALMKGSKEAYSLVVKNQYRELMGEDTQKKIHKEVKRGAKAGEKAADGIHRLEVMVGDLDAM